MEKYAEVRSLLRKAIPESKRSLGPDHFTTLEMVRYFARAVLNDQTTSDEKLEATSMLEDATRRMRFICGTSHPQTRCFEFESKQAREIVSRL